MANNPAAQDAYSAELSRAIQADFLLLEESKQASFLKRFGLDVTKMDFNALSIAELWAMEIDLLRSLTLEEMIRRVWIIREKFRLRAGESVYQAYLDNLPEPLADKALKEGADPAHFQLLKEDAVCLARQTQRMNFYRSLRNEAINQKKRVPIAIFFILLAVGSLIFYLFSSNAISQGWTLIYLTVYFGMFGAVVSLLQRLEQASNMPTSFSDSAMSYSDIETGMSTRYMISLIVSGAVFSVLVYLLSRSQLVNILELLPKPAGGECTMSTDSNFISKFLCAPYDSTQTAKLLILCFISGFAERFVPDVLDSLIKRTKAP